MKIYYNNELDNLCIIWKLILRSAEASDVLDDNLFPQMDITFGIFGRC